MQIVLYVRTMEALATSAEAENFLSNHTILKLLIIIAMST